MGPQGGFVFQFALDTGATTTLVSWSAAVQAGYDPSIVPDRRTITTGSGVEYCPVVPVERLEALGKAMRHIDVLCHDLPPSARVDGLLGLNFLSRFDLRINFKQGFITIG